MDHTLRCNSLNCRAQLKDRAVVTTCSHIFCLPCSQSLDGLANSKAAERICPACETQLGNPDDAVVTQLNPSEDYKTSVLSGLSPAVIMECAGRGLAFYSYQSTQEIVYQEFLAKSLTDKYSALSTQMDSIINQANNEIGALQEKLSAMHIEQKSLEQKNRELQDEYRKKAKAHVSVHKLYQSLKQQQIANGLQLAAENDAEDVLQGAGSRVPGLHSRLGSGGSGHSAGRRQSQNNFTVFEQRQYAGGGSGVGLQSAKKGPQIPITPSGHRTRLPQYGSRGPEIHMGAEGLRQPLQSMDPNTYGNPAVHGYAGGGMSAGLKFGRQHAEHAGQGRGGVVMGGPGRAGGFTMR